jgi:hypothetical protein
LVPIKQHTDFLHLARFVVYTQLPGYCIVRTQADAARHYSAWSRRVFLRCPDFEERVSFDGCEFIERNLPGDHGTAQPALPNACLKPATSTGWSRTPCARLYVRDNLFDRPLDQRRAEFEKRLTNARRLEGEGEMNAAANDDKSPLIDLLCCIVCSETMKLEKSSPDAEGMDIIQYRCGRCNRIERVRLFRRSRTA